MNGLSKSQKELLNVIGDFFNSKKLTFTISGAAGTGKSYIVKKIIDNIPRHVRVAVSAPTHKAVKVINSFTGKTGHTIHSLHGLRPNYSLDDFNIDNIKFETIASDKFSNYNVIFIDEASMINSDLKKLNDIRASQYNTKIVYIGDHLQLPPVKELNPSEVFSKVDSIFNLDDIIRQKETNPLLDLYDILRDDVTNNTAKFMDYVNKNVEVDLIQNNEGISILRYGKFKEKLVEYFTSSDFKNNVNFCRFATYTNDSVVLWNSFIRLMLFPTKELIVVGDILTSYKTIVDSNNSIILSNSSDYKVLTSIKRVSDDDFVVFDCELLELDTNRVVKVRIVDHTHPSFKNYYNKLNTLHRNAVYGKREDRSILFRAYFNYKDVNLSMITFPLKDGDRIRNWVPKEIYYGYGLTVHKLQGTTINNIFLDYTDICYYKSNKRLPRVNSESVPNAINLRNRLLYTGLTRVTNVAYLIY